MIWSVPVRAERQVELLFFCPIKTRYAIMIECLDICDWLWEKGHIRANNDFSV